MIAEHVRAIMEMQRPPGMSMEKWALTKSVVMVLPPWARVASLEASMPPWESVVVSAATALRLGATLPPWERVEALKAPLPPWARTPLLELSLSP